MPIKILWLLLFAFWFESESDKSQSDKSESDKSQSDKSQSDKSQSDKSQSDEFIYYELYLFRELFFYKF